MAVVSQLSRSRAGGQLLLRHFLAVAKWPPLVRFVLKRIGASVLLGLGITSITFVLTNLVPGDPVLANLGTEAASNPEVVKAYKSHYGLDRPLPEQYFLYLRNLAQGDLGISEQSHQKVSTDLATYIPATAELAVSATMFAVLIGIMLGTLAATRRDRATDHILRVVSLALTSTPAFWLGLVTVYVFFFKLGWLPGSGRLDAIADIPARVTGLYTVDSLLAGRIDTFMNALQHLVLPALVLAAFNIGVLIRFTRAAVLDVAQEEYITVARAKGLPEISVLRHILRSALPPVVTVIGVLLADALTGTVLIETIFSWPGVGRYAYLSAITLNLPAIMGVTLFVAVVFVTANLIVDVLSGVIDPRLRVS